MKDHDTIENGTIRPDQAEALGPTPSMAPTAPPSVDIHGLRFHAISPEQCVSFVTGSLKAGGGGWLVTPNTDILLQTRRDLAFRDLIRSASLVVADGMPVIWASRLQGTPLPGRVAGSDLIWSLCRGAAPAELPVFLLGGAPGAADLARERLEGKIPGLRVVATCCPPMGFERDEGEISRIIEKVKASGASIVFVGLGSPKTEHLIGRLRPLFPRIWWMGVGISFSFIAGTVRRAPPILQKTGLEWIHRLIQEPRRLARRYLLEDLPFAVRLLSQAAFHRIALKLRGNPQ